MRLNHWLSGLALVLCGTVCLADKPITQPVLGRAEPIGTLLTRENGAENGAVQLEVVFVFGDGDSQAASPMPLDAPTLGEPILLASLEEPPLPLPVAIDPSEVQQQLQRTAHLLNSAGLTKEARIVESVQRDFETKHLNRLKLAWKRAELAKLQAEIDELATLADELSDPADESQKPAGDLIAPPERLPQ